MWYWMQGDDPKGWLRGYARAGRSIEIQELALSPAQARSLAGALARNAQPDQMYYRYEPYRDNCSTRVRDALNVSLGGALERDLSALASGATFRSRTAELTAGSAPIYFGLMLLLGPSTDQPLSAWEDSFIPMNLAALPPARGRARGRRAARRRWSGGEPRPGMGAESGPRSAGAPSLLGWFLVFGVLVGGVLAWAGARSGAGRGRGPLLVLGSLWSLLSGGGGLPHGVPVGLHRPHLRLAQREPAPGERAGAGGVRLDGGVGPAGRAGAGVGARPRRSRSRCCPLAGVALQLMPWFSQVNGAALLFFVPANLGMALGAPAPHPLRLNRPEPFLRRREVGSDLQRPLVVVRRRGLVPLVLCQHRPPEQDQRI